VPIGARCRINRQNLAARQGNLATVPGHNRESDVIAREHKTNTPLVGSVSFRQAKHATLHAAASG
jgi:hypothetical protein